MHGTGLHSTHYVNLCHAVVGACDNYTILEEAFGLPTAVRLHTLTTFVDGAWSFIHSTRSVGAS